MHSRKNFDENDKSESFECFKIRISKNGTIIKKMAHPIEKLGLTYKN